MAALVEAIAEAIAESLDRPFAFFGHSMGAVVGFELAHLLHSRRGLGPVHLFVAGRGAPQLSTDDSRLCDLPEPELIHELRKMEGTPAEVLENVELLRLVLPLLRADFEVIGTYRHVPRSKLACPISAMGGTADHEISRDSLQAWCEQSSGAFCLRMFSGNHFFLHSQEKLIVHTVVEQLRRTVGSL
jgi:medium-chain acyl-[acyl-carrier-protein] hydrolase